MAEPNSALDLGNRLGWIATSQSNMDLIIKSAGLYRQKRNLHNVSATWYKLGYKHRPTRTCGIVGLHNVQHASENIIEDVV